MTFSAEDQKENVELAFRLLMAELGDKSIAKTFFDPSCQPFTAIYQTTWKELSDQGWADEIQLRSRTCYRLKGAGWIEGQWRTGESRGESLTQRMRRLAAVLKGHVKGRKQDVVIMLDDLVQESDLPRGMAF